MSEIRHTPGPWQAASHPSSIVGWPIVGAKGGRAIASVHVRMGTDTSEAGANARLIAAAPDMKAALDELEASFDRQIYPEQKRADFDAPDDHEYTVNITAAQWRALGRALAKAENG